MKKRLNERMPRRYILSHTSLRGIAALLVVFYHLQFGATFRFAWETATPFFAKGYLWVDLFFILSGFVIAYSARADEDAPYDWPHIRRFWVARFARIYPLHIACLFALLAIQSGLLLLGRLTGIALGKPDLWSAGSMLNFIEQLFLLNAWGLTGRVGWNIPSWSISAEMFAYLLFPLLAALLVRGGRAATAALLAGALAFYGWIGLTTGNLDIVIGLAILRCIAGFSLGMIIYRNRAWLDGLPDATLGAAQAIGLAIILAVLLLGLNDVIAIPGFVLLIASTWPDRGWLARPLAWPTLVWLGEISYSVYLVHVVLLPSWSAVMGGLLGKLGVGPVPARTIIMAGGLVMVLAVATFTWRFVELPARKAILRCYGARQARAPEAALQAPDRLT